MRQSAIGDPGVCHRRTIYGSHEVDRKASSSQTGHGRFQGPSQRETFLYELTPTEIQSREYLYQSFSTISFSASFDLYMNFVEKILDAYNTWLDISDLGEDLHMKGQVAHPPSTNLV